MADDNRRNHERQRRHDGREATTRTAVIIAAATALVLLMAWFFTLDGKDAGRWVAPTEGATTQLTTTTPRAQQLTATPG